jgi:hypothetical protein
VIPRTIPSPHSSALVANRVFRRRKVRQRLLPMRTEVRSAPQQLMGKHLQISYFPPLFFTFFLLTYNLDRQIPSVLSYVQGEEYHGTQAKTHLVRNSSSTIAYFRDFLGQESVTPCLLRLPDAISLTLYLQLQVNRPNVMSCIRAPNRT